MNLTNVLAVALGGSLGSAARYLVGVGVGKLFASSFPLGTLIINVVGSFILGALIEAFALRWSASEAMRAFLTIGICGGFTTFSTFSMDTVFLMQKGGVFLPLIYVVASVVLSVTALYVALYLMRLIL